MVPLRAPLRVLWVPLRVLRVLIGRLSAWCIRASHKSDDDST